MVELICEYDPAQVLDGPDAIAGLLADAMEAVRSMLIFIR